MQTRLRQLAVAAALTFGASAVVAIPAIAQQDENHQYKGQQSSAQTQRTNPDTYANHPDYSNNEYYRTGNDEGYQDYQAHKQREKHDHQYRNDEDRRAHDYGYQEGWSGRAYRDNQNNRGSQTYGDNQRYRDNDNKKDRDDQKYRNDQNTQYRDRDAQKHDKDDDHDAH